MIRACILLLIVMSFLENIQANDTHTDTFRLANSAFKEGSIDDAIQLYRAIADKGYVSLPLYFNLGSAYAKKRNWTEARYYLEQAHLENPLHKDVNKNLDFVKEQIDDPYTYPKYPLFSLIELIHSGLGRNVVSIFFLLCFLGCATSLYLRWIGQLKNKLVNWLFATFLIFFGIIMFFEQTYERFHARMVIVNLPTTNLYKIPDVEGEVAFDLQGGHKLRIQESIGPWYKVDLADGTEGWVPADHVKGLADKYKKKVDHMINL